MCLLHLRVHPLPLLATTMSFMSTNCLFSRLWARFWLFWFFFVILTIVISKELLRCFLFSFQLAFSQPLFTIFGAVLGQYCLLNCRLNWLRLEKRNRHCHLHPQVPLLRHPSLNHHQTLLSSCRRVRGSSYSDSFARSI